MNGFNYAETTGYTVGKVLDDLYALRSRGATLVRYQLIHLPSFFNHPTSIQDYWSWFLLACDRLEDVLNLLPEGMKMIIDLHTAPCGSANNNDYMYSSPPHYRAWLDSITALGHKFGQHDNVLGIDPKNEPVCTGMRKWNLAAKDAVAILKPLLGATQKIFLMMHTWDDLSMHKGFKFLGNDKIVYQFHFYQPRKLTGQGLFPEFPINPAVKISKPEIMHHLKPALDFKKLHKCQLFCGEFNASSFSGKQAEYLSTLIFMLNRRNISWAIHSWREAECWDTEKSGAINSITF